MKDFPASGFLHLPGLIDALAVRSVARLFAQGIAGERLPTDALGGGILEVVRMQAGHYLGAAVRPVRAILFDKQPGANWALGWHQDRTIQVRGERRPIPGFGPWTIKQGLLHVAPPISLLERMLTARIHVDPVDADNAPLLVAPGSHVRGLIRETEVEEVVAECGIHTCLADPGDVWLYSTPILHASARAVVPRRRRVLQVDFSADELPDGLQWGSQSA